MELTQCVQAMSATTPTMTSTAHYVTVDQGTRWVFRLECSVVCSDCEGIQQAARGQEGEAESQIWHCILHVNWEVPYTHYPKICELKAHHGAQVSTSYQNENAGKDFMHYIAMAKRQVLLQHLTKAKFFSLLLDRSTDKGNIDNEVLLAVWCDPDGTDKKVHTRMDYLMVSRPQSARANGLFQVLEGGLQSLGIKRQQRNARSL